MMAVHFFQIIWACIYSLRSNSPDIWCAASKSRLKVTKRSSRSKKFSCQFCTYELNAENPVFIWPSIGEIFAYKLLHRVFGFTVDPNQGLSSLNNFSWNCNIFYQNFPWKSALEGDPPVIPYSKVMTSSLQDRDFFVKKHSFGEKSMAILSFIHYPPIPEGISSIGCRIIARHLPGWGQTWLTPGVTCLTNPANYR